MPWQALANGTLWGLTDATLAAALGNPLPRFFMTGDGHRHPPFLWTAACPALKVHLQNLMLNKQLCVHVEQQPDEVSERSVPDFLMLLVSQRRVFGWELAIYKDLLPVMQECMRLAGGPSMAPSDIVNDVVHLDKDMIRLNALLWQIGNPPALQNIPAQSLRFRDYYEGVAHKGRARVPATELQYQQFLMSYYNAAMGLRTDVNSYIGRNIQTVISQFPNCTHLISCGDAHITHNNLSQFVTTTPPGAQGVVDDSNR
jgi:hypothetical protein